MAESVSRLRDARGFDFWAAALPLFDDGETSPVHRAFRFLEAAVGSSGADLPRIFELLDGTRCPTRVLSDVQIRCILDRVGSLGW